MRAIGEILATYLLAASMSDPAVMDYRREERRRNAGHGIPNKPKRVIPNGCKLFKIHGVEIVAISEKSAWKKYEKMQQRKEVRS